MRLRIAATFAGALFVLASLPGAASGDPHAGEPVAVTGTTDPPIVGEHRFVPANITVSPGGSVTFSNEEFSVGGFGAPHTWTVLTSDCYSTPTECDDYTTEVLHPGESETVALTNLANGTYTVICTVGQGESDPPFSLIFKPHATQDIYGNWTGMTGQVTVSSPPSV